MIKTLSKVGLEGTYLNIIKAVYMTNPLPASYSMGKNYTCFLEDQERGRGVRFLLSYST